MNVCLARIDDRLVHGQVIHGWVPRLRARLLLVADTRLSHNVEEQTIARLAVPDDVSIEFIEPERLTERLASETRPTVVLFRTPLQALLAVRHGFFPVVLNLGNLHFEPGKMQLRKTFCCSNGELEALRTIAAQGIAIDYQPAPDTKRVHVDLRA